MSQGAPPDGEWFRRLADHGALVFFILRVQPDLAFEFINDALESQIGVTAGAALADPAAVLGRIDAASAGRLAEALALPPGSETTVELVWRHRDGHERASRIRARSRQRDDGSVVLEGTARDITQLREAEIELQLSEKRHRLMAENAWEVIWIMAMDTSITYVSPAVEQVRGLTPEEAMSESLAEALTPESVQIALGYFQELFEAQENGAVLPHFHGEVDFYRKDGSVMSADLQVIPHVDDDGHIIELLGVSRDISERKRVEAELRKSEERARLMAENAWEIIWTAGPDGTATYINAAVERVRGITVEQAMDQPLEQIYAPSSADSIRTYFRDLHAAIRNGEKPPVYREEHEQYRADGSIMVSETQVIPHLDPEGRLVEIIGVTRDISERKKAEADLRRSEERYRLLAENAWDVVWTMDMDARITYVSPSIHRVLGITPDEAMFATLRQTLTPQSEASVLDYFRRLWAAIENGTEPPVLRDEHEYRRSDGSTLIGELQIVPNVDADGRVVEVLGVTRDISQRKAFEAELLRLAVTDALTGVWNRRHGEQLFQAELTDARETGRPLTLLMLDIDHFKSINDRYGHQAGDRVLIEVSRRLQEGLPSTDVVARWGGEEFVILLRDADIEDAVVTAEKLRGLIADNVFLDAGLVTASIGAAELTAGDDLDSWLAHADEALYKAKRSGRNAVRAY